MTGSATLHIKSTNRARNFREYRREPCPVCRHQGWCRRFDDGGIECMRIESASPTRNNGWMHWPDGRPDDWRERIAAVPPHLPRPTVDPDLVDRAYTELLRVCPISNANRAGLHARGLDDEQIARQSYGSLPEGEVAQERIAQEVAQAIGCDPAGRVPGFIRRNARLALVNIPGLLIPVRNAHGHIVGLKIRPHRQQLGRKYVWFSAGDGKGSIGQVGSVVHVANPPRPVSRRRVIVTEGALKANIIADRLGLVVVAVDGVSNTACLLAELEALGDVAEALLAFDEDAESNEYVAAAEGRTAHLLANAKFRVMQLTWPAAAGKGLDDILTSSPPTIPVAMPHPALRVEASLVAPVDVSQELAQTRRLQSLTQAAHRSPNLGTERHTLTDFVTLLAAQPEGEWNPATYAKIGDQAGVDARTAERHLGKVGIHPKERDPGILAGLIEVELREVPERVNPQTGQVAGGYDAVHVRRLAPLPVLLERIATAPAPATGKRNNHGGMRTPCPTCGETAIERTITDRCAGCGELINQTTQTLAGDASETPPRQDDAHPSDTNAPRELRIPTDTVLRGDKLSSTPEEPRTLAERARQATREDRRRLAYASLTALHAQASPEHDPDDQAFLEDDAGDPKPPPPLTLFPLQDAGCERCGAALAPGCRYCRTCDPRTA